MQMAFDCPKLFIQRHKILLPCCETAEWNDTIQMNVSAFFMTIFAFFCDWVSKPALSLPRTSHTFWYILMARIFFHFVPAMVSLMVERFECWKKSSLINFFLSWWILMIFTPDTFFRSIARYLAIGTTMLFIFIYFAPNIEMGFWNNVTSWRLGGGFCNRSARIRLFNCK